MIDLSIYYQNCRGMRTKSSTFYSNLIGSDYDIVCLSETWLDTDFDSYNYFTRDYYVYRKDRIFTPTLTTGGGVLIAVKKNIKVFRIFNLDFKDIECVWLNIKLGPECCLILGNHYLPPNINTDLLKEYADFLVENIDVSSNKLLLVGDFNVPKFDWVLGISNHYSSHVRKKSSIIHFLSSELNVEQRNNVRISDDDNLLDLVFTNFSDELNVSDSFTSLVRCDHQHPGLFVSLRLPDSVFNDHFTPYSKRNYSKGDYLGLYNFINDYKFTESQDVDVIVSDLSHALSLGMDMFIPTKIIRPSRFPPWFSTKLINLLRKKENLHKRLKRSNSDFLRLRFKTIRKQCKDILKRDERCYKQRVETDLVLDPKFFWRFVKTKYKTVNEINIVENGSILPPELVANKFAQEFHSVYDDAANLANEIVYDSFIDNDASFIDVPLINIKDVVLATKSLKSSSNSCGMDGVPSFILKGCINLLAPILCDIFNLCLAEGKFPIGWKTSVVVPVPKKGNLTLVKNYRPISLLSVFSKIFEKIVIKHLVFNLKPKLSTHQHGFLSGRSTNTNLVSFLQFSAPLVLNRKQCDVIYFDLSRAFDVVNHELLLQKLYKFGLSLKYLAFLRMYLSNRYFKVKIGDIFSDTFLVPCGVPQGSNFGPLLFISFIDDIKKVLSNSYFDLFADDLKIGHEISCLSDAERLQSNINSVTLWCKQNGMKCNADKIFVISYSRKKSHINYNYCINDVPIKRRYVHSDLGVTFDSKLKFDIHVESAVAKARKISNFVSWVAKGFQSPITHITLFNSLVRSKLEYCTEVWGNLGITRTKEIEMVQRLFLRKLTYRLYGQSLSYHVSTKKFKMNSLENRRLYKELCFIFKLLHNDIDCNYLLELIDIFVPRIGARHVTHFYPVGGNLSPLIPLNRFMYSCNRKCANFDFFNDKLIGLQKITSLVE